MKKPMLLLTACIWGLLLSSCHRDQETAPQPATNTKPHAQSLVSMGSEAWDPMTRHCDRIGRGCKEDVILCLTPNFSSMLFAALDDGTPQGIKAFFNEPANAECLPSQLTGDPEFMEMVNSEKMYSRFYMDDINPKRRIYLFGDRADLTITDNLLIVPFVYE